MSKDTTVYRAMPLPKYTCCAECGSILTRKCYCPICDIDEFFNDERWKEENLMSGDNR